MTIALASAFAISTSPDARASFEARLAAREGSDVVAPAQTTASAGRLLARFGGRGIVTRRAN